MDLFLRKALTGWDLSKAEGKSSGKAATGEQRGGAYVARVQTGYEKDGSPKYRYFDTEKEYESYLQGSGRKKERDADKKKQGEKLKDKTKKEHKEETKKQSKLFTAQSKKNKKDDKSVKKSLYALYLEVNDE